VAQNSRISTVIHRRGRKAVGAAHLPGDEGILVLLEQQGYTVTKLH